MLIPARPGWRVVIADIGHTTDKVDVRMRDIIAWDEAENTLLVPVTAEGRAGGAINAVYAIVQPDGQTIGEDGNAWSSLEDCLKQIGDGLLEAHTEWLAEVAERAA